MTDSPRPRLGWAPTVQPDRAHLFNPYRMTLAAMTYPAWRHCVLGAFRAACLALLGHPWMALVWFVASVAGDFTVQHLLRTWAARAVESDEAVPWKMGLLAAFRSALYMSAPTAAALMSGDVPELLFLAVMGGFSLVPVALSYGAFSAKVFWGFVLPPVAAFALVAVRELGFGDAMVMTCAIVSTLWVLAVVSLTWRESLGEWRRTHNASRDLIRELEVARDRAQEERASADIAREQARRAGQARAAFLANMSHEMRTPMNGVLGMAEALRRSAKDPDQAARLDMLVESGEHLLSILNDVLDMSKIDAGRLDLVLEPEDLPRFLQMVVAFWTPQAAAKGLKLDLVIEDTLPSVVSMDALRLRQVLYNLLSNALKYTEAGNVAVVARAGPVRQGRTRVVIAVSDTGRGIAAEELPTIFDRYAQRETVGDRHGIGLGLAICKQMTELMGGRLRVDSTPGQGSTFSVELVLELARSAELEQQARKAAKPAARTRRLKVLVVDDDAVNLTVVEQLLAGARHQVFRAASAVEALQLAQAQAFDLLLLDVHMPDMSGPAVLKTIRGREGPNRETPAVALTADVVSGTRAACLAQGFSEHATKPIRADELLAAIGRAAKAAPKRTPRAARRA